MIKLKDIPYSLLEYIAAAFNDNNYKVVVEKNLYDRDNCNISVLMKGED